ncbi:2594_t:CDS:2 [Funneliformis caledonium]|uniref:2594_t:CDS:1 n=1 Tax=Funneliformis caledonium TaxID=1117310 RepID=A0A9N9BKV7_9GLOM|nr:2594_t:CDS:2 [Funneliformis caledonium]
MKLLKREREKNPFRFKLQNEVEEKKVEIYEAIKEREREKKKKPFKPEDNV